MQIFFFDKCQAIDEEAVQQGTALASIQEVRQVNARFKQLAYLTDHVLHNMYMDYEEIESYDGNF